MAYGHQLAVQRRTVMVVDFTKHGHVQPADPKVTFVIGIFLNTTQVAEYLKQSGINRVVVGHKPVGDSPVIVREHGLEVVKSWVREFFTYILDCSVRHQLQ